MHICILTLRELFGGLPTTPGHCGGPLQVKKNWWIFPISCLLRSLSQHPSLRTSAPILFIPSSVPYVTIKTNAKPNKNEHYSCISKHISYIHQLLLFPLQLLKMSQWLSCSNDSKDNRSWYWMEQYWKPFPTTPVVAMRVMKPCGANGRTEFHKVTVLCCIG